jgi:hypothetical protein
MFGGNVTGRGVNKKWRNGCVARQIWEAVEAREEIEGRQSKRETER